MASTARKQISQETFDECVAENEEDFDMSLEEAVADAVQQFESQGVDLSNIIKSGAAQAADGQEPLPARLKRLVLELRALSKLKSEQDQVLGLVAELQGVCEEFPEARVVAGRNDAVDTLLTLLDADSAAVVASCSNLLALLCADNADNQDFVGVGGMQRLVAVLRRQREDAETVVRVLALMKAACVKHESNKAHFTKSNGVEALCGHLDRARDNEMLSKQLALCFRVLTINDDPRATFSQAQDTVKALAERDVIPYSLYVLRQVGRSDAATALNTSSDLLVNWLAVLKQLAVTEENCQQIADLDGLTTVQEVMQAYEHSAPVAKRCITVFRNVAAADDLKRAILQSGGVERTLLIMRRHEADASIQQNACATLAAIALRSPENSRVLVELGAVRQISRAMQAHRGDVAVLRQASLAVRNMVARSVELRPRFLHDEPEIEPLLREAQQYRDCGDEAYAALRDLGCDIQLSSFGAAAASAAASGSIKAPTIKPRFNPVQAQSNELLDNVEEAAEAPFAQ
ncbi:Armadillo repeat-containing protein 6 [Phytophthora pseudosyringae]|uniref:Armadillo repeat-containing protein 6 n=1 Tax=Phytophthora pseudosyringae TaxID=221518 RepID=A0A8T1WKA0_9STRA|nr:Armadillo repeat-containing protein 6 [Phytophthora pseudosyringae]